MGAIKEKADEVYRDFTTSGVAASGVHNPAKADQRQLFANIDEAVFAAQAGLTIVADLAARDAFFATAENQSRLVYVNDNNGSDSDPANGVYEYVDGAARLASGFYQGVAAVVQPLVDEAQAAAIEAGEFAADFELAYSARGKNFADPSLIRPGKYYSPGSNAIVGSTAYRCIGPIPVKPGQVVTVSGIEPEMLVATAETSEEASSANFTNLGSATGGTRTYTVPVGGNFLWVNLTNDGQAVTAYDGTVQIEDGPEVTSYAPFERLISKSRVEHGERFPVMVDEVGINKIDPSAVVFTQRHSNGSQSVIPADANLIARTDWIAVEPGAFYIVHGDGFYNPLSPQGGFYESYGDTGAVSNIVWSSPPSGEGMMFQVPETGTGFVVISLATTSDATPANRDLAGAVQMEKGEVATTIVPYEVRKVVAPANIPSGATVGSGAGSSVVLNDSAWYRYVEGEAQPYNRDKWSVYSERMLLKNADLTMLSTGTSLLARTTEHHSEHPEASIRPPLMHSLNLASHIWDKLVWPGQKYARYDEGETVAELSGSWATSHNLTEWDDGAYRNGLTRYSSTNGASISFDVPAGTFAWRFIHRTDTVASTNIGVSISDGNGNVEVFDEGTETWVEANGYSFTQRESAPATRTVSVPNPDTDIFADVTLASKGNTTYQKRLKFRCIDRASDRTITLTNQDDGTRFNYWGCEWSAREFMVTYINASRGSHNTQATGATGLPRFADNEVHSFKPDIIYGELPIHNDGAAGISSYATFDRWGRLTNNYVWRMDYELSLKTRAAFYGYVPEFGFWTPTIADNFGGISADGELLTSEMSDGTIMTALDKFDQAVAWSRENHPEAVIVHAVARWVEASFAIYGDLKTATQASSKAGPSLTNDGSHPNDVGSRILAKPVCGPLTLVH